MDLRLIHLDNALLSQPEFLAESERVGGCEFDMRKFGPSLRLWSRPEDLEAAVAKLTSLTNGACHEPSVTWLGSGDFHHLSAALVKQCASNVASPLTIVHFDNHPDWASFRGGMHCGGWVRDALKSPEVARVISLALTSRELAWPEFKGAGLEMLGSGKHVIFPLDPPQTFVFSHYGDAATYWQEHFSLHWKVFEPDVRSKFARSVLELIETDCVYVTIDKDVLSPLEALTNWDQGCLLLDDLIAWLKLIATHKSVMGIDVVGDYSPADYGKGVLDKALKLAESYLDQPTRVTGREAAAAINQTTNLRLLRAIGDVLR